MTPLASLDEYVRDSFAPAHPPSLSASVARRLVSESPRHAWYAHPRLNLDWQADHSRASDVGTIAHALLLERDESRMVVVQAPDWRTKEAQRLRTQAWAVGRLPVLTETMVEIRQMIASAREAIAESDEMRTVFAAGTPEQTFLWQESGAWCRCRPDWITDDHRVIVDVKTTTGSAEPDGFARRQVVPMGYDLQAAFARRAMKVHHNIDEAEVILMVIETEAPYAVSFVGLDPAMMAFAEARRQRAMTLWLECMATNKWPDYPRRVVWCAPNPWDVTREEEQVR